MLADFGERISPENRTAIDEALRSAREACSQKDPSLATAGAKKLQTILQEIGRQLYEESGAPASNAPSASSANSPFTSDAGRSSEARGTAGTPSNARVVDAEYCEVKPPFGK